MAKSNEPHADNSSVNYSAPTLKVYGDVIELTANGSGGPPEGSSGKPDKQK